MTVVPDLDPNGRLFNELRTPCLVLDGAALDRNIARMARLARDAAIRLRPHAKTHKSVDIAARQMEADAAGIGCATLDEAEMLADTNIRGLLLTSPADRRRCRDPADQAQSRARTASGHRPPDASRNSAKGDAARGSAVSLAGRCRRRPKADGRCIGRGWHTACSDDCRASAITVRGHPGLRG